MNITQALVAFAAFVFIRTVENMLSQQMRARALQVYLPNILGSIKVQNEKQNMEKVAHSHIQSRFKISPNNGQAAIVINRFVNREKEKPKQIRFTFRKMRNNKSFHV